MKISEIAQRLDKSKENESCIDTEEMGEEFGIDVPYVNQERLKCYWIGNWHCTDSYVGYRMYFFDDKPVALTVQIGRKYDEEFHWFSLEAATKVKEYLLSLVVKKEEELNIDIWDLSKEIGNSFKIDYNSEIIKTDKVTFNGEKVKLIKRIKNKENGIDTMQKIQLPNGETKEVDIKELRFGYHII
ncbi:hypothetical protein [Bacillus sp. Brlt_9]|uniref:hypothetical protein n=1 Tax=Bacillus sp. Brlt_9 TaxID=3110916 RepID=UPI003F7C572C